MTCNKHLHARMPLQLEVVTFTVCNASYSPTYFAPAQIVCLCKEIPGRSRADRQARFPCHSSARTSWCHMTRIPVRLAPVLLVISLGSVFKTKPTPRPCTAHVIRGFTAEAGFMQLDGNTHYRSLTDLATVTVTGSCSNIQRHPSTKAIQMHLHGFHHTEACKLAFLSCSTPTYMHASAGPALIL